MNKYWFRARRGIKSKDFGWGFIPISLEGVVAYLVLFALVILSGVYFDILHANTKQGYYFLVTIILLFSAFSIFAKLKTQR